MVNKRKWMKKVFDNERAEKVPMKGKILLFI